MDLDKIAFIMSLINKGNGGSNDNLSDYYTKLQTDARIAERIAEIVSNAPEDFDTLKELSDWIASHEDSAAAMNSAIADNTAAIAQKADKTTTYTKTETNNLLNNKVDKVVGKQLSTNDFTDAYKTKVDSLENYDDTDVKADIAEVTSQTAVNKSTLGCQRKNLLRITAIPNVLQSIEWTPNANGTITANGTAYNDSDYYIAGGWKTSNNVIERGDFIVSCEGLVSGLRMIVLDFSDGTNQKLYTVQQGSEIRLTDVQITGVYIHVVKNTIVDNLILKPMIRYAEITDDTYEPYKPSVEERLAALEEKFAALEGSAT